MEDSLKGIVKVFFVLGRSLPLLLKVLDIFLPPVRMIRKVDRISQVNLK
jgi:hypothetical protein